MFFIDRTLLSIALSCLLTGSAMAEGFVLGIGAAADTEDGRAYSAFGDFGVGEKTWLSATVGRTETDLLFSDFATQFYDVGYDHWFEPVGIRIGASYWGDPDILDSNDLRGSIYYRNDAITLAADYERRDFDFTFESIALQQRITAEFSADGWGLTARFKAADRVSLHLGGMRYDYSRNIRINPEIDTLRFLAVSRLSLINSLLDHRLNAGIEFRFGLSSLDLTVGNWETAVDQSRVNSYSIGFLTPMSDRTDIEIRLSLDDSENFGQTTALTAYLYYFGGS